MKKNVGTPNLLQLLIGLLLIPVATAYTLVNEDVYKSLTETFGYKLLWTTLIFLLLALIYTVIYFRFNSKDHLVGRENKTLSEKQIRQRLIILPQKEKEYLQKFLDSDESILNFQRTDEVAHSLELKGILANVSHPRSLLPTYSYKISDVEWAYLKKNPKVLKV